MRKVSASLCHRHLHRRNADTARAVLSVVAFEGLAQDDGRVDLRAVCAVYLVTVALFRLSVIVTSYGMDRMIHLVTACFRDREARSISSRQTCYW